MSYTPNPCPTDVNQIPTFLTQELNKIADAENQVSSHLGIEKSYNAPDKPYDGQIAYADGTHWNPGSGAGTYQFSSGVWKIFGNTSGTMTTGPGTYKSVTVDTYGRVTSGTNPTTVSGFGITDAVDTVTQGQVTVGKQFTGTVGIGPTVPGSQNTLYIDKLMSSATTNAFGVRNLSTIDSNVTATVRMFQTIPATATAAFTLTNLRHYEAAATTIGAGSTVTNNIGFYGNVSGGTNNYNFYAANTSLNYFGGDTTFATNVTVSGNHSITGTLNVTGIPTIPTASTGTNTTQAASTAYVLDAIATNPTGVNIQYFTSSGTFTVPANITKIRIQMYGGGGSGGYQPAVIYSGGGGGGGGYGEGVFTVTPGTAYTVTIGAGGAAGANNAGGNSSFGALMTCNGGGYGSNGVNGVTPGTQGAGGTVTGAGATIKISGGPGTVATGVIPGASFGPYGEADSTGTAYGAGGRGSNTTGAYGAGGDPGLCIVSW